MALKPAVRRLGANASPAALAAIGGMRGSDGTAVDHGGPRHCRSRLGRPQGLAGKTSAVNQRPMRQCGCYEERYRERVVHQLRLRANKLGMQLVAAEQPA